MIQTCAALSRKYSQERRQTADELGPTEDRSLGLLDCSNLSLGELPLDLLSEQAQELKHLILDENQLDEQALEDIPELPSLETLSLNGNCVKNCGVLFQILSRKIPNLKCLSLIGNPGWPHPVLNGNLQTYRKYALSAVQLFPGLLFLDTSRVSESKWKATNNNGTDGSLTKRDPLAAIASACHIV